jgi:predicted benzoate:H+ symporter BenE
MEKSSGRRARPSWGTLVVAFLTGLLVFLILFPASGVDSDPPVCRAMLFYVVPCERWVAPLVAITAAVVIGLALWWRIDRKQ